MDELNSNFYTSFLRPILLLNWTPIRTCAKIKSDKSSSRCSKRGIDLDLIQSILLIRVVGTAISQRLLIFLFVSLLILSFLFFSFFEIRQGKKTPVVCFSTEDCKTYLVLQENRDSFITSVVFVVLILL
jgi:hypothetical protein